LELKNQQLASEHEQLYKTAESGRLTEDRLRAEIAAHEQSKHKYEEALREWRGIMDSLRKAEGSSISFLF
jgi:hypothetical protein